eukprot:s411_g15.t1
MWSIISWALETCRSKRVSWSSLALRSLDSLGIESLKSQLGQVLPDIGVEPSLMSLASVLDFLIQGSAFEQHHSVQVLGSCLGPLGPPLVDLLDDFFLPFSVGVFLDLRRFLPVVVEVPGSFLLPSCLIVLELKPFASSLASMQRPLAGPGNSHSAGCDGGAV